MKADAAFTELVEAEKSKIDRNMEAYRRFLAYTRDDGPDDVEVWNGKKRFKKLRNTPIWALLTPARLLWHGIQFLYVHSTHGTYNLVVGLKNKIHDNKWTRRKAARAFLEEIMPPEEEKLRQSREVFQIMPKISVLVPLYNTPERFLRDMIESVTGQTYRNWELCLADASDDAHENVGRIVKEYARDQRIVYKKLKDNKGIADNTNACIRMASGEYLALFDHDDILHPSALYECAKVIASQGADFVYTDEVTFEGEDLENIITYHFKPDFSVDNLRGVNYICHLSVFCRSLVDQVGMFSREYDGSQDHDMIMRLTDAADLICHVPKVLYFWRCHEMSTSSNLDSKSYAIDAGRRAVRDAEKRRGYPAVVHSAQICKTHYRMIYEIGNPKITVFIEENGSRLAAHTAASIELASTYGNYEMEVLKPEDQMRQRAAEARGEYLIFLLGGIELISENWMEELLMFAQRKDVGAVGMQLLDENNLILSSDVVIGKTKEYLALEVNRGGAFDAPGYMGRNYYAHNISAVSGRACMVKKDVFLEYFPEGYSLSGGILAMCMALRSRKLQIVLNPYALCKMRKEDYREPLDDAERERLFSQFGGQIKAGDPFYNKNFSYERFWQRQDEKKC